MFFFEVNFFLFISILFVFYYFKPLVRYQLGILIAGSFIFYFISSGYLISIFIFSVLANVLLYFGIINTDTTAVKKKYLISGVLINIGLLFFFKYGHLVATSFSNESSEFNDFLLFVSLPVGISFYTFEGISLLVDTYKQGAQGKTESRLRMAGKVVLFISFFPHLAAGPILRANNFIPQIKNKYSKDIDFTYCFKRLIEGYFLKRVVADNLFSYISALKSPYMENLSSFTLGVLLIGCFIHLYADFMGYTRIAMGLAGLFGYKLDENFDYPLLATSLSEFWRRWHMTLSSFLRYYIYTLWLGGGRKGRLRSLFNIFITMLIGGFWHGAQWTFALWGGLMGSILVMEHYVRGWFRKSLKEVKNFFGWLFTMSFIIASMVFFKFSDLHDVGIYFISLMSNYDLPNDDRLISNIVFYSVPIAGIYVLYFVRKYEIMDVIYSRWNFVLYGSLLFLILTSRGYSVDFLYFRF